MKKKWGIVVTSVILVVVLIILTAWLFNKKWDIQFVEVASYDTGKALPHKDPLVWFSQRHDKYQGFFSIQELENYGIETQDMSFDLKNHTYIFTIGHELKSIEYSYSIFKKRRFIILPKQVIGIVTLDETLVNKVFVYRIRKMDIDCDYHDPKAYVTFS